MTTSEHPVVYDDFGAFEVGFLDPLSMRGFTRTTVPLSDMRGWQIETRANPLPANTLQSLREAVLVGADDDALRALLTPAIASSVQLLRISGRYTIEGWDCRPDNGAEWDPILPEEGWGQPGNIQHCGVVAQVLDLDAYALVRGIWEPGNVGRGWKGSSLLADVSAKYSPGNKAMWVGHGTIPALADFVEDLRADSRNIIGQIEQAPYDGARDDKANFHGLLRASRDEIGEAVARLDPRAQRRYALISPRLMDELVRRGLVPIHLRDLLSLVPRGQ